MKKFLIITKGFSAMKKIIATSFLLFFLIAINTTNAQLNVPHGWKDDGGTRPIYPVANDYSVDKQICIGTNTANPNVSLTIVGSQTVTGNVSIGTSTTKSDAVLNIVGSVTVSQGIKFGDNTTLTSTGGLVTTTAIQDIAHGGTEGTTSANARTNLGVARSGVNTDITSLSNVRLKNTTIFPYEDGDFFNFSVKNIANAITMAFDTNAGIAIHRSSPNYVKTVLNNGFCINGDNSENLSSPLCTYAQCGDLPESGYGFSGNNQLALMVSSSAKVTINGTGTGFGTTTPQTLVHIYGTGETTLVTIGVNTPAGSTTASTVFLACNTTDGMQGGITGSAVPGVITFVTQTSAHLSQLSGDSEIPEIGQVVELTGNVMQSSLTQYLPTCRLCKTKESSAVYGIYLGAMSDNKSLEIAKATKPTQEQLVSVIEGINKIKGDYEFIKAERLADIARAEKNYIASQPQTIIRNQTLDIAGNLVEKVTIELYQLTETDKKALYIEASQSEITASHPIINTILSQEFKVCNIGGGGTIPAIVSNSNGNITCGDLLVSDGNGNCMRQNDTIIRSSTIGKACVSVDWSKEPAKTKLIGILGYSG